MKTVANQARKEAFPEVLPVIPTMDVVVFPNMIVPLLVVDERIIHGVNRSLEDSKMVFLLAAKNQLDGNGAIGTQDLHQVGTIASIMRMIQLPEGGIKILVQGIAKARVKDLTTENDTFCAHLERIDLSEGDLTEVTAQVKNIKTLTEQMAAAGYTFSPDFHMILSKMTDPAKVADFILSHLTMPVDYAQKLLEAETEKQLLDGIYEFLYKEIEVAEMQEKIRNNARDSMNKSQKEYYLREQIRAIKKELGEDDAEDVDDMRQKLETLQASDETKAEVRRQINRLEQTAPDSLEATVIRNYLEWVFALPWGVNTVDNLDLDHAQQVLDEDHYGLKKIKDRILDFISIRSLNKDGYTPILCLVGPPGTGKTSLGMSIARSLGRNYIRLSLGGVKDEAEIRGHRRTYVGAMPGRFIQAIRKAGSSNPLIIIDELDKIGSDFRGDPSAAMLEVLDPQQNNTFYDNYLGVPFDLSKCMFIATANSLETISGPLLDRMEVIDLSGYTMDEKANIAQRYLVQKAIKDTGLADQPVVFSDDLIKTLIMDYSRESGVRQLERLVKILCSKIARTLVAEKKLVTITPENIERYLGPRKFLADDECKDDQIGISNGLAWTSVGGEVMQIEAVFMPGKGRLILTGHLGDVMKESAQAALSYARSHAKEFSFDPRCLDTHDLHIHVPAGAVPKDGPSGGVAMLTAILSAITQRPVNADYAMTGEINLRGDVMPIGGVKEKILAAKRNKIAHVILPHKNRNDLVDLPEVTDGIDIIFVHDAHEVVDQVLHPKTAHKGMPKTATTSKSTISSVPASASARNRTASSKKV